MDEGTGTTRACVALGVLCLHALFAVWLAGMRLPHDAAGAGDAAIDVVFVQRPPDRTPLPATDVKPTQAAPVRGTPPAVRLPPRADRNAPPAAERPIAANAATDMSPPDMSPPDMSPPDMSSARSPGRPLDLSLGHAVETSPPGPPGLTRSPPPWERDPPAVVRRTRFDAAWAPSGNALDQAAFRSPIVRGMLHAFGGPPKRCNEIERRLRKMNCLPEDDDLPP